MPGLCGLGRAAAGPLGLLLRLHGCHPPLTQAPWCASAPAAVRQEEDVDDDDAAAMAHIYQAFEELIQAAYELVQVRLLHRGCCQAGMGSWHTHVGHASMDQLDFFTIGCGSEEVILHA